MMIWGHPKTRQGRPLDPLLVTVQPDLILFLHGIYYSMVYHRCKGVERAKPPKPQKGTAANPQPLVWGMRRLLAQSVPEAYALGLLAILQKRASNNIDFS